MRVHVYPADPFACGHVRMVWPALAAAAADPSVEITVVPAGDPSGLSVYSDKQGKVRDVVAPDCDVLVLQRPTFPQVAGAVPLLRRKGVAVVVDIDDDLAHIHPDNPAWLAMHPDAVRVLVHDDDGQMLEGPALPKQLKPGLAGSVWVTLGGRPYRVIKTRPNPHSWRSVAEACQAATMTTVSTPALLSRYGGGNGHVLYNYVPELSLLTERRDSDVIGWAGSTHSHPTDLRAMALPPGARFRVVGDGTGAGRDLGLAEDPEQSGPVEFGDWPRAVAGIGVGVAPLADTRFNAAKSWLKPLEYSAAGVPWVASPRVEYRRLAALGAGVLAEKPREWVRELRRLTQDAAWRAEQSEAVREMARGLTIEAHAWRWLEAWRLAWDRQRGRVPAGATVR